MNKIKSIKTFFVGEEDELMPSTYEERDQLGNVTLLQQYNYNGDIESKSEFTFDEKGRLIVEKQYSVLEMPDQTINIQYNESGKAHEVRVSYADGTFSLKKYSRDEAAHTTTIDIFDQDGEKEGKEHRKFDSEGRILLEEIHDDFGKIESKSEYEYDDYGNITESVIMDNEGFETVRFFDYYRDDESRVAKIETLNEKEEIIRVDEYEFDEHNNQIKHTIKDLERGAIYINNRDFDDKGNETRLERLFGDRPVEVVESVFNENGLMISRESRQTDGVMTYRYEYEMF